MNLKIWSTFLLIFLFCFLIFHVAVYFIENTYKENLLKVINQNYDHIMSHHKTFYSQTMTKYIENTLQNEIEKKKCLIKNLRSIATEEEIKEKAELSYLKFHKEEKNSQPNNHQTTNTLEKDTITIHTPEFTAKIKISNLLKNLPKNEHFILTDKELTTIFFGSTQYIPTGVLDSLKGENYKIIEFKNKIYYFQELSSIKGLYVLFSIKKADLEEQFFQYLQQSIKKAYLGKVYLYLIIFFLFFLLIAFFIGYNLQNLHKCNERILKALQGKMTTAPSVIFSEFKTLNKNLDEFLNRYFQLLNGEEIKRLKEENAKLKGEIETLKNALENRELRIKQLHKAIVNEEIQKIMEERKKRNT